MSLAAVALVAGAGVSGGLEIVAKLGGVDGTSVRNVGGLVLLPILLLSYLAACAAVALGRITPPVPIPPTLLPPSGGAAVEAVVSAVLGAPAIVFAFFLVRAALSPLPDVPACSPAHPSRFDAPMFFHTIRDLVPEDMAVFPPPDASFPHVRQVLPSGDLAPVDLKSLYADKPLVLETGSISCPIFCLRIAQMAKLVEEYGDRVNFVVLYGGEAHPTGGRDDVNTPIPADPSQTVRAARVQRLRAELGLSRRVLVDGADGALQARFAFMPNAVTVVDCKGNVTFFSRWNFPVQTRRAIRQVLGEASADEPLPKPSGPGDADMEGLGHAKVLGLLYRISGLVGLADLLMSLLHSQVGGALKSVGIPISLVTSDTISRRICAPSKA
jgi:Iodothyronine deiodinase